MFLLLSMLLPLIFPGIVLLNSYRVRLLSCRVLLSYSISVGVIQRWRAIEAFHSPMIRFQAFRAPGLSGFVNYNCPSVVLFIYCPLGETKELVATEVGYFPYTVWVRLW